MQQPPVRPQQPKDLWFQRENVGFEKPMGRKYNMPARPYMEIPSWDRLSRQGDSDYAAASKEKNSSILCWSPTEEDEEMFN